MHSQNSRRHSDGSDPRSRVNYRFLSTLQKDKHLQRLQRQHCIDQRKIVCLTAKLEAVVEQRGVSARKIYMTI